MKTTQFLEAKSQEHFPKKTRDGLYDAWTRIDRMEKFVTKFKGAKTDSVKANLKLAKMHLEKSNTALADLLGPWAAMLKDERK